jgi:uncharacterized protein (DUF4415 family)
MAKRKMVDRDNPIWTEKDFAAARPASKVLPRAPYDALPKRRGRPKSVATKTLITIRVDGSVRKAFKATGRGWQTRMHDVLRRAATKLPGRSKLKNARRARA